MSVPERTVEAARARRFNRQGRGPGATMGQILDAVTNPSTLVNGTPLGDDALVRIGDVVEALRERHVVPGGVIEYGSAAEFIERRFKTVERMAADESETERRRCATCGGAPGNQCPDCTDGDWTRGGGR